MSSLPKNFWRFIFIFLLVVAACMSTWFIIDLRSLYQTGKLRPTRKLTEYLNRQILTPDQIESWMTFSYINYTFGLPPSYLQDSLGINDARYPNLEIHKYSEANNLNTSNFLIDVINSVTEYHK